VVVPLLGLALALAAAAVYAYLNHVPSPGAVLARMRGAGEAVEEISCVLRAPWPEAFPPASGLPGARALLAAAGTARSWSIQWKAGTGFRAEALEPPGAAGTLTVASGGRWWTYSPLLCLALSGSGEVPPLFLSELTGMLSSGTGQATARTTAPPTGRRRGLTVSAAIGDDRLVVDVDRSSWLPLRARLTDAAGRVLASLEIEQLDLSPGLEDGVFSFEPPAGTRVLAGLFAASYPDVESAAAGLPFQPKVPGNLPAGFDLSAVNVTGEGSSRALVVTWAAATGASPAGGLVSLTQSLCVEGYGPLPYGRPEKRGGIEAQVFELGDLRGVDWRQGDLSFTLFGNLSFDQLLSVAASIR